MSKGNATAAKPAKSLGGSALKSKLINNVVWLLLLFGIVIFIILKPEIFNPFTNPQLYLNIPETAAVMGVLTIGLAGTLLLGDIDLSTIGMMAFSTAIGALVFKDTGMPALLAMLLIVAIAGIVGFINGLLIAKLKTVALIETLAMNTTLAGVVLAITQGRTITVSEPDYVLIGQSDFFGIPYLLIILFAVYFIMWLVWKRTRLGRSIFAVGGNANCAKVSGINVDRTRILTFTISGICAGLAGFMLSSRMSSINSVFGSTYSMDIIAAAVIGGTSLSGGVGRVSGVLGGVLLINFIKIGLQVFGIDAYFVQMATGIIIMLAVVIDSLRIRAMNTR